MDVTTAPVNVITYIMRLYVLVLFLVAVIKIYGEKQLKEGEFLFFSLTVRESTVCPGGQGVAERAQGRCLHRDTVTRKTQTVAGAKFHNS